jgi:hypothetical protein
MKDLYRLRWYYPLLWPEIGLGHFPVACASQGLPCGKKGAESRKLCFNYHDKRF